MPVGFDRDRVRLAKAAVVSACRERGVGMAISAVPTDDTAYYPGCFCSAGVEATVLSAGLVNRLAAARAAVATAGP